ncbi:MAG: GNAT family N-acetyltransferase [Candidatus Pedobacter colombiensis]|uniref:GNAT family N-acetyltransferase n=1 Tax=Candidatus Pedobacter colombiensis TaxID=3121371 RepID=A0AAJ5W6Q1_9SPHI|nr:GNAT family N-acetyltransferase [Pedobacter sp.]WEK17999.1 MAG: GNAT family N-acetyltransferase [Pedobacter sp.]
MDKKRASQQEHVTFNSLINRMEIFRVNNTQGNLIFDLFDQYRVFYKQESDIKLAEDFIQARLDNNESVIFVAVINDKSKPVGFTQLYPKYSSARAVKNWILNDLYVAKEHRKQGIGEKLIKMAMAFAKENNAKFVELSTAIDNYTAQSLYEQIGFEIQNPEIDFYTYRISLT